MIKTEHQELSRSYTKTSSLLGLASDSRHEINCEKGLHARTNSQVGALDPGSSLPHSNVSVFPSAIVEGLCD